MNTNFREEHGDNKNPPVASRGFLLSFPLASPRTIDRLFGLP
jgi:hypothetical protein